MVISKIIHLGTTLRVFYADYITKTLVANGVTLGLASSFATTQVAAMSLGQVLKGLGAAFMATPIGWISAVALGIFALVKASDFLTVSAAEAKEKLEKTVQELADLRSEQESLNNELETTRQRIAELKAQGTLTFTEEAELTRLQKENAELERKLELTEANKAASKEETLNNFKDAFEKDYGAGVEFDPDGGKWTFWDGVWKGDDDIQKYQQYIDDTFYWLDRYKRLGQDASKEIENLNNVYSDYQDYLKTLDDAGYVYGTDEQIDAYIDQIEDFNDRYLAAFGNTEKLFAQVVSRDKFADGYAAIKELGNVTQETLSKLYNENEKVRELINYLMGLGTVDWKSILGEDRFNELDKDASGTLTTLELFDEETGECKVTSEQFSQAMSGVANEFNQVEESAEAAETSFESIAKTLSDGLDTLSNKKDILSEVKEELNSFGTISAANISKILELFADDIGVQQAVAYYLSGIGTAQQVYDAIAKGYQNDLKLQAQTLATKMQNDEKYYKSIGATNKSFVDYMKTNYGVDLSNATSLADAKLKIENDLIGTLKTNWQKYYNAQGASIEELVARARAHVRNTSRGRETYAGEHEEATKRYNEIYAVYKQYKNASAELDQLILKGFNSSGFDEILTTDFDGSSGSKTNETAEKKIANLKHQHEMGLISEETYYKKLDGIRKKYYAGKKNYLDRDRELQEEYHDWEVSKAEESYEKQAAKLQEQYVNGEITYAQLKSKLKSLINKTFKNDKDTKDKYLDELPEYLNESREEKRDKNRENFDAEYDKLKYQLENGFITEEQYYKNLDTLYKKHYSNKSAYLEEYEEYSQEVYDGFKDLYKEDLEAQKKSLEEQKEAITEYYDDLIEKKQEEHDAEDYEEEQTEKRQTLSDIERQIAELEKDGSEKAKARIAELEEDRKNAEKELEDFEKDHARQEEIERLEKEREAREKEVQDKIDNIDTTLGKLDSNTKDIRNAVIQYAKAKGVDIKFAYASGTRSSVGGFGRINEKGIEMISAPDGNGNYVPMLPNSYVFSARATEFLWKLATEHSLPQAMYNSIAKSIKTQSSTPSVNIAQPITITMGDIIIKGNADKQTVADIKKQQENTVRMVLQKIKELQK